MFQLKHLSAMLLDTQLADVWKANNPGALLVFFGADWLNPQDKEHHGC